VDFVFAIWLATGWRMRWALAGMALSVVIYTIAFSLFSPAACWRRWEASQRIW